MTEECIHGASIPLQSRLVEGIMWRVIIALLILHMGFYLVKEDRESVS